MEKLAREAQSDSIDTFDDTSCFLDNLLNVDNSNFHQMFITENVLLCKANETYREAFLGVYFISSLSLTGLSNKIYFDIKHI